MKKYLIAASSAALVFSVAAAVVLPTYATHKGNGGPSANSNVGHLTLVKKDPANNWQVVPGTEGTLKYVLSSPRFNFVFEGSGLTPNTSYSLIYYADGWPGNNPGALIA